MTALAKGAEPASGYRQVTSSERLVGPYPQPPPLWAWFIPSHRPRQSLLPPALCIRPHGRSLSLSAECVWVAGDRPLGFGLSPPHTNCGPKAPERGGVGGADMGGSGSGDGGMDS